MPASTNGAGRTGSALVISLAFIVLATVVVLAFFSMATSHTRVESSRNHRASAELLAGSAGMYVTQLFTQEIADPANSDVHVTANIPVYTARAAANMVPKRALATAVQPGDEPFFNLVRQSVPTADPNAATDPTTTPSREGRVLSRGRWNAPQLIANGGFQSDAQLPNWIYVDGATGANANPTTAGTIGRFAYNVYDIGGLLNANAAGYPEGADPTNLFQLKSTAAGADLTHLATTLAAPKITEFTKFRNLDTSNLLSYVDDALSSNALGFLTIRSKNPLTSATYRHNLFTSRQDLLRYVRMKNPDFQAALPYLTHFSRAVNAPASVPVNPPGSTLDYFGKANDTASANRDLPNVRVQKAGTVTHYLDNGSTETYPVQVGDSLIQHRFSLRKLATWLPVQGTADAQMAARIQAVFGLAWEPAEERWNYVGPTGTNPQSAIKTLEEIAGESAPREPNFFELLKAGILSGSLGGTTVADEYQSYFGSTGTMDVQRNKDLQILRIGASMIDQADTDSYPTIVALSYAGLAVEEAGVEDIPYLHSVLMAGIREMDGVSPNYRLMSGDIVWVPIFFNPHQPTLVTTTERPEALQMAIASGDLTQAEYNGAGATFAQPVTDDLSSRPAIELPRDATANLPGYEFFRDLARPLRNSDPTNPQRLDKLAYFTHPDTGVVTSNILAAQADIKGFLIFSWQKQYTGAGKQAGTFPGTWFLKPGTSMVANGYAYVVRVQNLNYVMRYKTKTGKWKTYATIGGTEALPTTGLNGAKNDGISAPVQAIRCGRHFSDTAHNSHSIDYSYHMYPYDPRSCRFGPILARYWDLEKPPMLAYTTGPGHSGVPPGMVPEAGKGPTIVPTSFSPSPTNFADPDGIYRPTDGYLAPAQTNPYKQVLNNKLVPDHPSRPIILNRPFQSVGELGYTFRDAPWKSISFFDDTSGDGALLELFSVADEPLITAGRVSFHGMQSAVKEALLANAGQAVYSGTGAYVSLPLTAATVTAVSDAFSTGSAGYAYNNGVPSATMPRGLAQLPAFMSSTTLSTAALDPLKNRREAVVRALVDVSQSRTWNLLIDVVAQSGRFAKGTTAPAASKFVVEGEQRHWISIAIDRPTGKIIAQQTESVNE